MTYNEHPKVKGMKMGSPQVEVRVHEPMMGIDEESQKFHLQRKKRQMEHLKALEKHPAHTDDKIAAALMRHGLKKEIMKHKARMMEDEASEMEPPDLKDMEPDTPITKKGSKVSGNPYEVVPKGGGVVVRNKQTGKVHGHFSSKREAMKQFRLLEMIEHGVKPRGR